MICTSSHHSFDINLATEYGVNEAILIHHFQHWIRVNKTLKKNFHDGKTWSYQTLEWIAAHFPYLSKETVRDTLYKLCNGKSRKSNNDSFAPVLMKGNYNKKSYDRTVWYAFCDESLFLKGTDTKSLTLQDDSQATKPYDLGISPNAYSEIPTPIPDTKPYTKSLIEKIIDKESMPRQIRKEKKDDPRDFLSKEQKTYFDRLIKLIPERGEKLDVSAVSYWIKTFGIERTKESVVVYWEQVDKAKRNGNVPMPESAGAYIRSILNDPMIKPENENMKENKRVAQEMSKNHRCIEILEKYVRLAKGSFRKEMYYTCPVELFSRWMHENLENLRAF